MGGYGFGGFLLVVGLVLALAVQDGISGVDLTAVGWILVVVGAAVLALTALTFNRTHRARTVQTTTHADGTQSVRENRTDIV